MGRGQAGIWKRRGRPNWYAWIDGKQVNLGTDNERDALKEWHARSGGTPEPSSEALGRKVRRLLDQFLVHLRDAGRNDYGWYRQRIKSFSDSIPASLKIGTLRPHHVTSWIARHSDWSPTYAAGCIGAVQRAFNWHVEEGHLSASPLAKIRKPKRDRREFVYAPDQIKALLAAMPDHARQFFTLVAATGCRPSEMAAALASDVAHDGATIAVRKSKTGRKRQMPVPANLRAWLLEIAKKGKGGRLCKMLEGSAWNRVAWGRALRAAKEASGLGLPAEADAYAFRHTWITERIREGVPIAKVALATGTSVAMIARHYGHLGDADVRELADRL